MKKTILFAWVLFSAFALFSQPVFIKKVGDEYTNYSATNTLLLYTSGNGDSLFRSNGTPAGSYLIKTGLNQASNFTSVGNLVFFTDIGGAGYRLWSSSGSTAGTVLLGSFTEVTSLTALGTHLVFIAQTTSGRELWRSNGSVGGTYMVKDINPGPADGLAANAELEAVGNVVYFPANNGTQGTELWKSNETLAGTVLVKDIAPGAASSNPFGLTKVGTQLYFFTHNPEATLWKSNGTGAGTTSIYVHPYIVHDIDAADVNGIFYYAAYGSFDSELWRSNGTPAGTMSIYVGFPELIVPYNVNGTLAFTVNNHEIWQLYRSTGMPGGHTLIDDGYWEHEIAVIGRYIFYPEAATNSIFDEEYFDELWQSDLTPEETRMIKDWYPSLDTTFALSANLTVVGNTLYFTSENNKTDDGPTTNLWRLTPQDRFVSSLTLVNSNTDADIMTLEDGDTIYASQDVNVRANISGTAGSVRFYINDAPFSLENVAPYALAGDNSGNYNEWMKPLGLVKITAVPYSGSGGSGTAGVPYSVTVRVLPSSMMAARTAYTYPNPVNDQVTVILQDESTEEAEVSITDLTGREYFSGKVNSVDGVVNIDLLSTNMTTGIYLIRVNKESGTEIVKMIKK